MKTSSHNLYTVYNIKDILDVVKQTIRIRYGLHWQKSYPTTSQLKETLKVIFYLLLILLAYGIVGRLDYEDELLQQKINAESYKQTLLNCMSGASGFYFADSKSAFSCEVHPL